MNVDVSIRRIQELLDIERFKDNYNIIFLNVNSLFSTMFYSTIVDEIIYDKDKYRSYIADINDMLRGFLVSVAVKKVYLYMTNTAGENLHYSLSPNWRSEWVELKDNPATSVIYKFFVNKLKELADASDNVTMWETEICEPSLIPFDYAKNINPNEDILILSRDRLDACCLILDNVSLWDGMDLVISTEFRYHTSNKLPNYIQPRLLPIYFCMRGIPRLNYAGVKGFGEKRTKDFFMNNASKLHDDDFLKNHINMESLELLDFNRYISKHRLDAPDI
ncbi:MAG: hypothetical protein ACRC92_26850 [Peptostreptococcaceae bacterium]